MASRTDRYIDGMFSGRVNPKDGYAVADCKDPRVKRVLEFLVPLLYSEKPTRVTITVGNTIFGALSGERPVDWGVVIKDLVQRLLSGMGKLKATPICPYIFHLYHSHELLLPAEKKEYRIQEALVKHNVESDEDEDPASRQTWMKRGARTTRTNVRVSHPVRSGRSRSRKRPGSRNHESTRGSNHQQPRSRYQTNGRVQPFGRTGPELPGDCARAEGHSRAGA